MRILVALVLLPESWDHKSHMTCSQQWLCWQRLTEIYQFSDWLTISSSQMLIVWNAQNLYSLSLVYLSSLSLSLFPVFISLLCPHAPSSLLVDSMPHLLILMQKYIQYFLMHINKFWLIHTHMAVLLASWSGRSFFHTYLWLEAGGIHPILGPRNLHVRR
jgi:hypothetical protein